MVACLVETFCLVFHGFHWLLGFIGLVDDGLVRDLSFGALPRPFFYSWDAKLAIFLVLQTFVRRFGGLSVGVWYWIWSLL